MDEEQTQEESRAQQIARRLGMAVGGAARGVGSTADRAVGRLASIDTSQVRLPSFPSVEAAPVIEGEGELDDLFEVPEPEDNDINCDDLLELDEEEGVEDLLTVSHEDIVNGNDKPKPKPQLVRTNKPYPPMLTGMR